VLLNKSVTEDTVKYFSRMSRKLVHSNNIPGICFTVSGIPQNESIFQICEQTDKRAHRNTSHSSSVTKTAQNVLADYTTEQGLH